MTYSPIQSHSDSFNTDNKKYKDILKGVIFDKHRFLLLISLVLRQFEWRVLVNMLYNPKWSFSGF